MDRPSLGKAMRGGLVLWLFCTLAACQAEKQTEVALVTGSPAIEQTYHEGRAAFEAGEYDLATEKFARVATADPQHFNALVNWGAALSRDKQPAEAILKFQQALALAPEHPNRAEVYYNWGVALERLGKHQEAVEKFQQALALKSTLSSVALQRYMERYSPMVRDTQIGIPSTTPPMTSPPIPPPAPR